MAKQPRSLGGNDLVLSHMSLDRSHPIEDRIASAAAAGFDAIGLFLMDYDRLKKEGKSAAYLHELLAKYDICLAEIEVIQGWAGNAAALERCAYLETLAWEMADEFECRYLQVIGPFEGTMAEAAVAFGGVCDRAGEHGLVVGLEFLPFTNIYNARDARHIAQAADRPNGGLCVDIWHHTRGSNDLTMIADLPPELVKGIQMSDGPREPVWPNDYYNDCLRTRLAPGEGDFDVHGFVTTLIATGCNIPWSLEVCNDDVWGHPGGEHAKRCADGMRAALALATAGS